MKINGMADFLNAIDRLKKDFPAETDKFMTKQALKLEKETKKLTPVDTGTLRASWGHVKGKEKFERIIYSKADYAAHVEFDGIDRKYKGQYMLKRACDKVESEFEEELNALARRLLK